MKVQSKDDKRDSQDEPHTSLVLHSHRSEAGGCAEEQWLQSRRCLQIQLSVEATDSGRYLRAMVASTSLFTNTVVVLRLRTVDDTSEQWLQTRRCLQMAMGATYASDSSLASTGISYDSDSDSPNPG